MSESFSRSPPTFGKIQRPRGWIALSSDEPASPFATHGSGTLTNLIKSRSHASLAALSHRAASYRAGRDSLDIDGEEDDEILSPLARRATRDVEEVEEFRRSTEERRMSVLNTPHMRSQRLIGNSNPRYKWERYWKTEDDLKDMKKPIREYYDRTNLLVQNYLYIDRLLDSSLPHDLLNEYNDLPSAGPSSSALNTLEVPPTITEEPRTPGSDEENRLTSSGPGTANGDGAGHKKVKRTPRNIYKVSEMSPLLADTEDDEDGPKPEIPGFEDDSVESGDRIVQVAIYINLAANFILLAGKIAVIVLTNSLSVLASLVDAALDFLSTAIVWTTTRLIERQDQYMYPVGRRRLEPIGVLVFAVIMVTSFFQVGLECLSRLNSMDHSIIELTLPAIIIMSSTVVIKGLCWFWCRLVKNSSVQALAADAATDVVFNIFSIIFPLVGFYAKLWWLDALGGLLLSLFVIFNWAGVSTEHIRNLTGAAATADQRNVLLYLTMRFAKTIKQIQGLQAYHAGDKLNVEVDIILDENINLKDSHDLGESLQYVLESVPTVDRAFVHIDYASWNLPTHMQQQSE